MKTYKLSGSRWLFEQLKLSYLRRFDLIEARLNIGAWVGILGFPVYYVIWTYWFPQPYENIVLRLICSVSCIFLLPWPSLGRRLNNYYPVYVYTVSMLNIPAFFTFMLLMNESNVVWMSSALIALFILPLFFDWRNQLVMIVIGVSVGVLGFELSHPDPVYPNQFWMYMPVFFFALLCGIAFNFSDEMLMEQRRKSMMSISANMAHEMRTPLLTVRSAAEGMRFYWPLLTQAYRQLEKEDRIEGGIEPEHWEALEESLDHMVTEVKRMNAVVNMVLMNLRGTEQSQPMETLRMADVVREAVDRYHFDPGEREKLHLALNEDFSFQGRSLLVTHILFNLFKNAYYAIAHARKGEINLWLEPGETTHRLIVRDTALGMAPHVASRIFEPFYTTRGDAGTGVGLAFCQRAMEDMQGRITVDSMEGQYTQFTLMFPILEDQQE